MNEINYHQKDLVKTDELNQMLESQLNQIFEKEYEYLKKSIISLLKVFEEIKILGFFH
jgi:hypothetical protein